MGSKLRVFFLCFFKYIQFCEIAVGNVELIFIPMFFKIKTVRIRCLTSFKFHFYFIFVQTIFSKNFTVYISTLTYA